jgi:uncharacterized protein (TIGR02996 family)
MSPRKPLSPVSDAEAPLLRAVRAAPDDDAPRLIYADWLEEHGDVRGEYLRLACALASLAEGDPRFEGFVTRFRELRFLIDPKWRAAVARSGVENCARFEFRCPKRWDKLQPTGDEAVRFCTACRKEVYYCESIAEARQHASLGRCVALDPAVPRSKGDLDVEEEVVGELLDFDDAPEPARRNLGPGGRGGSSKRRWWRFGL